MNSNLNLLLSLVFALTNLVACEISTQQSQNVEQLRLKCGEDGSKCSLLIAQVCSLA